MYERKKLGLLQTTHQGKLSFHGGKMALNSPMSKKRKNDENQTPVMVGRKDGIYEDPPLPSPAPKRAKLCTADAAIQTLLTGPECQAEQSSEDTSLGKGIANKKTSKLSAEQSTSTSSDGRSSTKQASAISEAQAVVDMLTSAKPNEKYWEMVASERKSALRSSLTENKQLHHRNTQLQGEVHQLADKVQSLTEENTLLDEMLKEAKMLAELVMNATTEAELTPAGSAAEAEDTPAAPLVEEEAVPAVEEEEDEDDEELAAPLTAAQ